MPTTLLTDIVAKKAKAIPGRQRTIWDSSLRGFGLRVGGEAKTWTVMVGKDRRRITIGRYPVMGLQIARSEAKKLILASAVAHHRPGITPISVSAGVAKFVDVQLPKIRASTAKEYERILRKHFESAWKNKLIHDITRADIHRVLDELVVETPIMANHAFAIIRLFLRWAIRRGYLENSPCEAMQSPAKRRTRDRVLNREELKVILAAAQESGMFGTIVRLLAFTAQRRGEIANLRSEWIDPDKLVITLPKAFTKNEREHMFPISPTVLNLLPTQKGLLFVARGTEEAFNGWSKSMDAFRKKCGVPDFNLHDLRRTAATGMAELGTPPHVIERILNHMTGTTNHSISPLGRIYNRHTYLNEMREALNRWDAHVVELIAR
jgi:integrase